MTPPPDPAVPVTPAAPADLAGPAHWNDVWGVATRRALSPWSYYTARLDAVFARHVGVGTRVVEIGAGNSRWLPFLARRYGCDVWGIDYSAPGVAQARARLHAAGVTGSERIVQGDVFAPHPALEGRFDVLWSAGFVEHFDDVSRAVRRLAEFLRPGGVMLTLVPNMDGAIGCLHRWADPSVFAMHQRLAPARLDAEHRAAGLEVVEPGVYLGVFSLGVVNAGRLRRPLPAWVDRAVWGTVLGFQQAVCLPWRVLGWHPESRAWSPYVVGCYRRPA